MDIFFAFVALLNAIGMIAMGYLLWNLNETFDRKLTDAIRKQDDRLRKRQGSTVNGQQTGETQAQESDSGEGRREANQEAGAPARQIGRPWRPRR